jgi:hypothetical protein
MARVSQSDVRHFKAQLSFLMAFDEHSWLVFILIDDKV